MAEAGSLIIGRTAARTGRPPRDFFGKPRRNGDVVHIGDDADSPSQANLEAEHAMGAEFILK